MPYWVILCVLAWISVTFIKNHAKFTKYNIFTPVYVFRVAISACLGVAALEHMFCGGVAHQVNRTGVLSIRLDRPAIERMFCLSSCCIKSSENAQVQHIDGRRYVKTGLKTGLPLHEKRLTSGKNHGTMGA